MNRQRLAGLLLLLLPVLMAPGGEDGSKPNQEVEDSKTTEQDFRKAAEQRFLESYKEGVYGGAQTPENKLSSWAFRERIRTMDAEEILRSGVDFHSDPVRAQLLWKLYESGHEFPNYFAEMVSQKKGSGKRDFRAAERTIEAALASVLKRLQIPYFKNGRMQISDFFRELGRTIREEDPKAHVMIAGGVVRSLLGYLYEEIYFAKQRNPEITPWEVLNQITHSEEPVKPLSALGVGSDLDILVIPGSKDRMPQVKDKALDLINSAEKYSGLREMESKLKYSIVPIGDLKDYQEQMDRATSQGGSTLDWLVYPIEGGRMKTPVRDPNIFQRFILGKYSYLPSAPAPLDEKGLAVLKEKEKKGKSKAEDLDKQSIRGLRPLLEMGFIDLTPASEEQLHRELLLLKEKLEKGGDLSPKTLEQFDKMFRNSRFQGAHGRFFTSSGRIASLVQEISRLHQQRVSGFPLVYEFATHQDPAKRRVSNHSLDSHLMSLADFETKHTHNGVLYHGTSKIDNILGIIRNGLVLSDEKQHQGVSMFGRGAYVAPDFKIAEEYGIPIDLKLKRNVPTRIVEWDAIKGLDEIVKLRARAEKQHVDPFKLLAEEYGIDVIVNTYPLVQNTGIFDLPKNTEELIRIYGNRVKKELNSLNTEFSKEQLRSVALLLKEYQSLKDLGKSLGMPSNEFFQVSSLKPEIMAQLLDSLDDDDHKSAVFLLKALPPIKNTALLEKLQTKLESMRHDLSDPAKVGSRVSVLSALKDCYPSFQEEFNRACASRSVVSAFLTALEGKDRTIDRVGTGKAFQELKPLDPSLHLQIAEGMSKVDWQNLDAVTEVLREAKPDAKVQITLINSLKSDKRILGYDESLVKILRDAKLEEPVSKALERTIQDFKKSLTHEKTAITSYRTLEQLAELNPDVNSFLGEYLKTPEFRKHLVNSFEDHERSDEALSLLQVMKNPNRVSLVPDLLPLLVKPGSSCYVFEGLRRIAKGDTQAEAEIAQAKQNPLFHRALAHELFDPFKGTSAKNLLKSLVPSDPQVYDIIASGMKKISGPRDAYSGFPFIEFLQTVAPTQPGAVKALFECISEETPLFPHCLSALEVISETQGEVRDQLNALMSKPSFFIPYQLNLVRKWDLSSIARLKEHKPKELQVLMAIVEKLQTYGSADQAIDLLKILQPQDPKVQIAILESNGARGKEAIIDLFKTLKPWSVPVQMQLIENLGFARWGAKHTLASALVEHMAPLSAETEDFLVSKIKTLSQKPLSGSVVESFSKLYTIFQKLAPESKNMGQLKSDPEFQKWVVKLALQHGYELDKSILPSLYAQSDDSSRNIRRELLHAVGNSYQIESIFQSLARTSPSLYSALAEDLAEQDLSSEAIREALKLIEKSYTYHKSPELQLNLVKALKSKRRNAPDISRVLRNSTPTDLRVIKLLREFMAEGGDRELFEAIKPILSDRYSIDKSLSEELNQEINKLEEYYKKQAQSPSEGKNQESICLPESDSSVFPVIEKEASQIKPLSDP